MKICPNCMRQYDDGVDVCEDDGTRLRGFVDQASRMVGQVLDGRWEIEAKIAEGGMGEVYRARQVTMERVVAVKLIRSALSDSEEYVRRFFREANILATIHHPHFVTIYDYGQATGGVLYIAMEFLRGITLGERLETSRLGLCEIVKVGAQISAALDVAHRNQVVHRDLKPDNVFLVDVPDDVFVKVLDFGIAKQLDADGTPVTRTGQVFGTPEYMSPEQCENATTLDHRSDIYSLGVILYELLTGRLPYDAESAIKMMVEKISGEAIPVDEHDIAIPPPFADVVMRMLRMDPDERPASAAEVRDELKGVFDWIREHPEAIDAYGAAELKVAEHPRGGTRRLDSAALTDDRQVAQRELLSSREIVWEDSSELPFDFGDRGVPKRGRRAGAFAAVGLVALAGAAAFALPSVRKAFQPEEPVRVVQLSPTAIADARAAAHRTVESAAHEGSVETVRHIAVRQGEGLAFDAAVVAATLSNTPLDEPDRVASRRPSSTDKPADGDPQRRGLLNIRTRTSIERRIRRYQPKLVHCYEARANPAEQGSVAFQFRIDPSGKVDHFELKSSDFGSDVGDCVESKVRGWTFRKGKLGSGYDTHARTVTFREE